MTPPSLDIVLVNWNSGDQLREAVSSIRAAARPPVELRHVIVVDNGSTDGSAEGLSTEVPLKLLRNAENRGFAAACNQGARAGDAAHVLFLNPDTRLLERSLVAPMEFMNAPEHADVGICGVQLLNEAGRVAPSCSRFPTPAQLVFHAAGLDRIAPRLFRPALMAEWDHADTRRVDQVMGAFFWIRRPLFEELGGFDERFFVYYEEVDLAFRAAQRGHPSVHLASAQTFHRGQGTTRNARRARLTYSVRSRLLYAQKHFSAPSAAVVAASALLIEPLARIALAAASRSWTDVREIALAYRALLAEPRRLVSR